MQLLCVFRAADLGNVCYLHMYIFLRQCYSLAMEVPFTVDETMLTIMQCTDYTAFPNQSGMQPFWNVY